MWGMHLAKHLSYLSVHLQRRCRNFRSLSQIMQYTQAVQVRFRPGWPSCEAAFQDDRLRNLITIGKTCFYTIGIEALCISAQDITQVLELLFRRSFVGSSNRAVLVHVIVPPFLKVTTTLLFIILDHHDNIIKRALSGSSSIWTVFNRGSLSSRS